MITTLYISSRKISLWNIHFYDSKWQYFHHLASSEFPLVLSEILFHQRWTFQAKILLQEI